MNYDSSLIRLPEFANITADGLNKGRSVRDGYCRGWGLKIGDLKSQITKDALYQEALALAQGRTVLTEDNLMNIFLIIIFYLENLPLGHITEFGSYKGGSAIFMAKVCQVLHPGMSVYAFDTFCGMPEIDSKIDAHSTGDFSDINYEELQDYIASIGLTNLKLVPGQFEETAPLMLPQVGSIRMTHIDCDIRSAVAYSYDASLPYMVEGGYIVLDDATGCSCLGATEVVEDLIIRRDGLNSEQIFPQYVFRASPRR